MDVFVSTCRLSPVSPLASRAVVSGYTLSRIGIVYAASYALRLKDTRKRSNTTRPAPLSEAPSRIFVSRWAGCPTSKISDEHEPRTYYAVNRIDARSAHPLANVAFPGAREYRPSMPCSPSGTPQSWQGAAALSGAHRSRAASPHISAPAGPSPALAGLRRWKLSPAVEPSTPGSCACQWSSLMSCWPWWTK